MSQSFGLSYRAQRGALAQCKVTRRHLNDFDSGETDAQALDAA